MLDVCSCGWKLCIFYALRLPWNKYHDQNMQQTFVLSSTSSSNCNFDISVPDWWNLYLVSPSLWIYNTVYLIFNSFIFARFSSLMIKYLVKTFTQYISIKNFSLCLRIFKQIRFDHLSRQILQQNLKVVCWQSLITD